MQCSKIHTHPVEIKILILLVLIIIASSLVFVSPSHGAPGSIYDIIDYGAIGDGVTLNTKSIQDAIDDCAKKGGGTVNFPAGTFLSGTIYLKNNICLYLEPGTILLGSTNVEDYPLNKTRFPSGSDRYVARALIWGEDLHNLTITGRGIINGQGSIFSDSPISQEEWEDLVTVFTDSTRFLPQPFYINRPYLIRMVSCRNVLIEKVSLQKPAMWLQQYLNCEYLTLRDLHIYSHGNPNNDLIDIDGTQNVIISGIYGDSDDDGITLKSTTGRPVQNVTISDCIIRSRTNAIKAGTESASGFKDITITNCIIKPSLADTGYSGRAEGLAGIALELVDGGVIDRVTISNIAIEDMAAPIFLRLGNRARPNRPHQEKKPVGSFRNVKINNITATNAGRNGCSILGIKGHYIENVSISDVFINFDGGGTKAQAEAVYPENDEDYPESTRYGDLPAYGFFCRHVDGLTFRDVEFSFNDHEVRSPLIFDDVKNLNLFNVNGQVSNEASAQMIFNDCQNVFISECRPPVMDVFMRLGQNSDQIKIVGNDLSHVKRPFILDESVQMSALEAVYNLPADQTLFSMLEPTIERDEFGKIKMRSFTSNSEIRYTLDDSDVTLKSKKYTQPFKQVGPCDVKAKVFKDGSESRMASTNLSRLQVIKPKITPAHSFFQKSVQVILNCATPDAEIRYTLDETIPLKDWTIYTKPFGLKKSGTLNVRALKKGHRHSEIAVSKNELIPEKNGVHYRYYLGKWDKIPDVLELKPVKTGVIKQFRLEEIKTRKNDFALLMIGFVTVKKAGNFTFYSGSNDGSKLYIDNALLVDNDGSHGFLESAGDIYLSKGMHSVEVRYLQLGGSKSLKVSWKGEEFDKRELSSELLNAF
jgi:polygalacturonase